MDECENCHTVGLPGFCLPVLFTLDTIFYVVCLCSFSLITALHHLLLLQSKSHTERVNKESSSAHLWLFYNITEGSFDLT